MPMDIARVPSESFELAFFEKGTNGGTFCPLYCSLYAHPGK